MTKKWANNSRSTMYIGITGQKFKDRLKEHIMDIKLKKPFTALASFNKKQN